MARTLDQILAELDSTYNPQVENLRKQQALIPGQIASQEQGLQAKQDQAFGDILGGARQRGLGFSGIPLAEQAKYTATNYLPALAQLRTAGTQQATSLEDAINQVMERRNTFGQQVYQQEQDRAEQQRQFDAQQSAARQAAAQQANTYSGLFGGQPSPQPNTQKQLDPVAQKAYNDVQNLLSKGGARIQQEYTAIKKSAGYGNAYDKMKQALIEQLYPAARNFGKSVIPLGPANPTIVNLSQAPYTGLRVGVANPGRL